MIYFNYQLPIIVYFQKQQTNCYYMTSDNVFSDWLTSLVYGCATVVVFCFVIVLCLVPKIACVSVLLIPNYPPPSPSLRYSLTSINMWEEYTDERFIFVLCVFCVSVLSIHSHTHTPFFPSVLSNVYYHVWRIYQWYTVVEF